MIFFKYRIQTIKNKTNLTEIFSCVTILIIRFRNIEVDERMTVYFNLSNPKLPFSIESIGNHWDQVSLQRMKGYPLYHWLQKEKGIGEIWIENQKIRLNIGEGILIAPFVAYAYYPITKDWQTNFATFDGNLKQHFNDILANQTFILVKNSEHFSFTHNIQKMITAFEKEPEQFSLSVLCYQFLLKLGQSYEPIENDELFKKYIQPSLTEIQEHYTEAITVTQLAQNRYISPQYFSRVFKKFMGQSPYQYLTDYRIRQAKELLINKPELSIQQIAIKVGFDSTSQFIDLFKKRTGYTPKKFRGLY